MVTCAGWNEYSQGNLNDMQALWLISRQKKKLFVTHNYLSYKGIRNEIEVFFSTMVSDHLFTFSLPPKFRWHDDYFRRLQLFFMYIFLAMISLHSQQIILWSDLRDVKDVNTFRFLFCFVLFFFLFTFI